MRRPALLLLLALVVAAISWIAWPRARRDVRPLGADNHSRDEDRPGSALATVAAPVLHGGGREDAGVPVSRETAEHVLDDIQKRLALIEKGLVTDPCGEGRATATQEFSALFYTYLRLGGRRAEAGWRTNADVSSTVYQAAANAVCHVLPAVRDASDCDDAEVRHDAIIALSRVVEGAYEDPAAYAPEWLSVQKAFVCDMGYYADLAYDVDQTLARWAMRVIVFTAPRSPLAWDIVRAGLAGDEGIGPGVLQIVEDAKRHRRYFTPLILASVFDREPPRGDSILKYVSPMETKPPLGLEDQMRAALDGESRVRRVAVLRAVATPGCIGFLAPAIAILENREDPDRRAAAKAIGGMGRDAKAALTALARTLQDDGSRLDWDVLRAIKGIGVPSRVAVAAIRQYANGGRPGNLPDMFLHKDDIRAVDPSDPAWASAWAMFVRRFSKESK